MTEPALNYDSNTGYLTINGVSMHCPAWTMFDLLELWVPAPGVRGTNVKIPGAQGTLAQRRRIDESRYSLPIAIAGWHNRTGTPYSDPYIGLETNIAYLYSHVVTAGTTAKTYAATLQMPSGATRSANVQVEGITYTTHAKDLVMDATLELVIPGGVFA